jgi:hypothetical protein
MKFTSQSLPVYAATAGTLRMATNDADTHSPVTDVQFDGPWILDTGLFVYNKGKGLDLQTKGRFTYHEGEKSYPAEFSIRCSVNSNTGRITSAFAQYARGLGWTPTMSQSLPDGAFSVLDRWVGAHYKGKFFNQITPRTVIYTDLPSTLNPRSQKASPLLKKLKQSLDQINKFGAGESLPIPKPPRGWRSNPQGWTAQLETPFGVLELNLPLANASDPDPQVTVTGTFQINQTGSTDQVIAELNQQIKKTTTQIRTYLNAAHRGLRG